MTEHLRYPALRIRRIQENADLNFFGGTMEDLIAYAGGSPPPPPPSLEKRVEDLERWAMELGAWAREQGYDGIGPGVNHPGGLTKSETGRLGRFLFEPGLTWE